MIPCPRCGAPLPADGSPCPRCLMELGRSVDADAETTALPPEEPPPDLGTVGPLPAFATGFRALAFEVLVHLRDLTLTHDLHGAEIGEGRVND